MSWGAGSGMNRNFQISKCRSRPFWLHLFAAMGKRWKVSLAHKQSYQTPSTWGSLETLKIVLSDSSFNPNNKRHLASAFYREKGLTIAQARLQVVQDAIDVRKKIVAICNTMKAGGKGSLDDFFKPLTNTEIGSRSLQQSKGRKRLIAVYAIRISPMHYVLTGGAIKLVHLMRDQNETYQQLIRLQTTASYLKAQGVIDEESFYEFIVDEA